MNRHLKNNMTRRTYYNPKINGPYIYTPRLIKAKLKAAAKTKSSSSKLSSFTTSTSCIQTSTSTYSTIQTPKILINTTTSHDQPYIPSVIVPEGIDPTTNLIEATMPVSNTNASSTVSFNQVDGDVVGTPVLIGIVVGVCLFVSLVGAVLYRHSTKIWNSTIGDLHDDESRKILAPKNVKRNQNEQAESIQNTIDIDLNDPNIVVSSFVREPSFSIPIAAIRKVHAPSIRSLASNGQIAISGVIDPDIVPSYFLTDNDTAIAFSSDGTPLYSIPVDMLEHLPDKHASVRESYLIPTFN